MKKYENHKRHLMQQILNTKHGLKSIKTDIYESMDLSVEMDLNYVKWNLIVSNLQFNFIKCQIRYFTIFNAFFEFDKSVFF